MNKKDKFIILLGPTAVGKTDLSIELAKEFDGEVVSCDSMQIYKGMDIGTAKITKEEMDGIPHHIIDIIEPDKEFTVSDYSNLAKEKIREINSRGKIPIFVGGTGLYINSLVYDLDFTEVRPNYDIRDKYETLVEEKGNDYVHNILSEIDPESAKKLHPNDSRRVIRAIEIYESTGEKMSERNKNFRKPNKDYDIYMLGLKMDRQKLYKRINKRVDIMIDNGLLEEVNSLLRDGFNRDMVSMQAIGYKEIIDYIEGNTSLEEAITILKRNSRRYAKRQLTWFRKEERVNWIDVENYDKNKLFLDINNKLINI